jgi:formylglycine-generating enzyme required for sulfatase activity
MKAFKIQNIKLGLSALSFGVSLAAFGQQPVITSFSQNGQLVCANLATGTVASVEWASSLSGPWTNWAGAAGLDAVTVNSNGTISVSVPMFYRVRGVAYTPTTTPDGMVLIPVGMFTMGNFITNDISITNDPDITDANPTNVTVSAFYMDTNLVSYTLWTNVYQWVTSHGYGFDHAGSGKTANHPVYAVDWYDMVKWSNARSQQAGLTPVYYTDAGLTQVYTNGDVSLTNANVNWAANGYRLPTEAEWEKAARGGLSGQRFPWGNTISESQANYNANISYSYDLGPYGWNSIGLIGGWPYMSPVGSFAANGYGLYDMAGNVWEWCWDWYGTPYAGGSDPRGPASGSSRVLRGGTWVHDASNCRCAIRVFTTPPDWSDHNGFRCVRGL